MSAGPGQRMFFLTTVRGLFVDPPAVLLVIAPSILRGAGVARRAVGIASVRLFHGKFELAMAVPTWKSFEPGIFGWFCRFGDSGS